MSLKRKFKMERAPLVSSEEVQRIKLKYGQKKQCQQPQEPLVITPRHLVPVC